MPGVPGKNGAARGAPQRAAGQLREDEEGKNGCGAKRQQKQDSVCLFCLSPSHRLHNVHHYVTNNPPRARFSRAQLANEVKAVPAAVKISAVLPAKESHLTPYAASALQKAITEAREATSMYGAASSEAAVLWDVVEELSASDNSQALQPALSEECLVDMMEACEALEELQNKVIKELHK